TSIHTLSLHDALPIFLSFHSFSRFHPHLALGVIYQAVQVLFDLGHAEHFFDGGRAGADLVPAVSPQRAHASINGLLGDSRSGLRSEEHTSELQSRFDL